MKEKTLEFGERLVRLTKEETETEFRYQVSVYLTKRTLVDLGGIYKSKLYPLAYWEADGYNRYPRSFKNWRLALTDLIETAFCDGCDDLKSDCCCRKQMVTFSEDNMSSESFHEMLDCIVASGW